MQLLQSLFSRPNFVFSLVLGLGVAYLIKIWCIEDYCAVVRMPTIQEVEQREFKSDADGKCYKLQSKSTTCPVPKK